MWLLGVQITMKLTVYVETSVWSHALAEDAPESHAATLRFFDYARQGGCELFVSEVVLDEIARAETDLARQLHGLVSELRPVVLELDEEAQLLAARFLEMGAIPPGKPDDARHVAIAMVNALDVLVSWNYRHLVNVRRREAFQHIGAMQGYYKPLHIATPAEVIEYDDQQGT
jgi:predicted nucleic acid-binding protein